MIDQKVLKARRASRRVGSARRTTHHDDDDIAAVPSDTPSTAPSAIGSTGAAVGVGGTKKIAMTWSELEASVAAAEKVEGGARCPTKVGTGGTPRKKAPPPSSSSSSSSSKSITKRPPLSASAKKCKSYLAGANDATARRSEARAAERSLSSTPPRLKNNKIKIIMTTDDLTKSIAVAEEAVNAATAATAATGGERVASGKRGGLDREALKARRARMLRDRPSSSSSSSSREGGGLSSSSSAAAMGKRYQNLSSAAAPQGGRDGGEESAREETTQTPDSSLTSRIRSGMTLAQSSSEKMTTGSGNDFTARASPSGGSALKTRVRAAERGKGKNLVGDLEGERGPQQEEDCSKMMTSPLSSSPLTSPSFSSGITRRSRDAAAKLVARSKRRSREGLPANGHLVSPEPSNNTPSSSREKDTPTARRSAASRSKDSPKLGDSPRKVGSPFLPVDKNVVPSEESSVGSETSSRENIDDDDEKVESGAIPEEDPSGAAGATSTTSTSRTPLKALPLSVRRDRARRVEHRRASRGAAAAGKEPETTTRRNLDKRTARIRFADDFRAEIGKRWTGSVATAAARKGGDSAAADPYRRERNGISVFVRKRPLFEYEQERGDYDVVEMSGVALNSGGCGGDSDDSGNYDGVTVHNCTMHPDMKRMYVQQVTFPCSATFDDRCSNDDVFNGIAAPLVRLAAGGNAATILMYGQTGSGKTHTMTGIEERTTSMLFDELAAAAAAESSGAPRTRNRSSGREPPAPPKVSVQFVELCGKSCRDLLGRMGEEVKLAEEKDGSVRLLNATTAVAESSDDLSWLIAQGKCRRATEATDVNGVSSRSHAVCLIEIRFPNRRKRGLLTLIDCAGSERRHDTMYHSSERQKESAEINASLWSLKECIRARNGSEVVPYRSSLLTRILRESFERDGARLSVIATVAPNATDTEHTSETLRTVSTIVGCDGLISEGEKREVSPRRKKNKPDAIPPRAWNHSQLTAFLVRKKIDVKVPEGIDGKTVMRMNVQQIRARLCRGGSGDDRVPKLIFDALRKENDRVDAVQRKEKLEMKKRKKEAEWENTAVYR